MQEKDPVLEKNFIIFMVLVMVCLFAWMWYMGKTHPAKKTAPATASQPGPQPSPVPAAPAPGTTAAPPGAPAPEITPPVQAPLPAAAPEAPAVPREEKTFEVKSPLYRVVFTNRGAAPISWELLHYQDRVYFPYEINLKWPPLKKVDKFQPVPVEMIPPGFEDHPPLSGKIRLNN